MGTVLKKITVSDYRCFAGSQTARLAPITLLVGENSTGKTSMMAMVRAMWDITFGDRAPDFKEDPYDLGSFDEIAHDQGAGATPIETFGASLEFESTDRPHEISGICIGEATFESRWGAASLVRRRVSHNAYWMEQYIDDTGHQTALINTPDRKSPYRMSYPNRMSYPIRPSSNREMEQLPPLEFILRTIDHEFNESQSGKDEHGSSVRVSGVGPLNLERIYEQLYPFFQHGHTHTRRPFASAPVRSQPKRTYDPVRTIQDTEGNYIPSHLAQLSLRRSEAWSGLKKRLEEFGREAGLFDVIDILRHGDTDSAPFQIQVSRSDGRRGHSRRNLIDVGYGVSQVLSIITELLREDGPSLMLLQQPEVHLHPSAQASLGNLLCQLVADKAHGRQLVVETHSDFIIDRVRMAARDGIGGLEPDDISIVYFERADHAVRVHSIGVDSDGNLLGVPSGYRSFFMDESRWLFGF